MTTYPHSPFFHPWVSSARWLLSSQSQPPPTFRAKTDQCQSRSQPLLHLSSFPSSIPQFSSFSFTPNPSNHPYLHPHIHIRCCTSDDNNNPSNDSSSSNGSNNGSNNNGSNNNGSNSNSNKNPFNHDDDSPSPLGYPLLLFFFSPAEIDKKHEKKLLASLLFLLSLFASFSPHSRLLPLALAQPSNEDDDSRGNILVWQVKGSKWIKVVYDASQEALIPCADAAGSVGASFQLFAPWQQAAWLFLRLMLPDGYPHSVTSDYLEYSLWRGVQGVACQINHILATQSLLYAVGLGKGAIPTVAAVNWVLKDGIGYLSKIMLSKLGRHFDVHPKGWRLFADLLENAAFGLELLTPAFPQLFVFMGAIAASSRSAASLIQASTRSCFYAGFAAQRNFAEVIAKGEAQGMVSKSIGIMLGIALANHIGSSTILALGSFFVVSGIHMFCNWKSYLSIQLRTLNPYRASLVFSEYLLTGQIPPIEEVNEEEPLFPSWTLTTAKPRSIVQSAVLSPEAKNAVSQIEHRLLLGSKLSAVVNSKEDASALFDLFIDENYILTEHKGRFCVILKEGCAPHDMLKSLFHVNYLHWLERNVGIESRGVAGDCSPGGRLDISLDYVKREFNHVKHDGQLAGWVMDGLIARPLPNRIRLGYTAAA